VTDLLLRQAQAGRGGAQGDYDYDVIGTDGIVIGRIFKATSSPAGTPWMWSLAYGERMDMRQHARPLCRHSLTAGTERREQGAKLRLIEKVRLDGGAARPLESVIAGPPLPLRPP
jgi:hypothetical protein